MVFFYAFSLYNKYMSKITLGLVSAGTAITTTAAIAIPLTLNRSQKETISYDKMLHDIHDRLSDLELDGSTSSIDFKDFKDSIEKIVNDKHVTIKKAVLDEVEVEIEKLTSLHQTLDSKHALLDDGLDNIETAISLYEDGLIGGYDLEYLDTEIRNAVNQSSFNLVLDSIENSENKINFMQKEIDILDAANTNKNASLDGIKTTIGTIQTEIDNLNTSLGNNTNEFVDLKVQLTSSKTSIDGILADITTLKAEKQLSDISVQNSLSGVISNFENLSSQVDSIGDSVLNSGTNILANTTAIDGIKVFIESLIGDGTATGVMTKLDNDMAQLIIEKENMSDAILQLQNNYDSIANSLSAFSNQALSNTGDITQLAQDVRSNFFVGQSNQASFMNIKEVVDINVDDIAELKTMFGNQIALFDDFKTNNAAEIANLKVAVDDIGIEIKEIETFFVETIDELSDFVTQKFSDQDIKIYNLQNDIDNLWRQGSSGSAMLEHVVAETFTPYPSNEFTMALPYKTELFDEFKVFISKGTKQNDSGYEKFSLPNHFSIGDKQFYSLDYTSNKHLRSVIFSMEKVSASIIKFNLEQTAYSVLSNRNGNDSHSNANGDLIPSIMKWSTSNNSDMGVMAVEMFHVQDFNETYEEVYGVAL